MTADVSLSRKAPGPDPEPRRAALVRPAPADDTPDARHKLSPARGLVLGLAICAVFWLAVWGLVTLLRG